MASDVGNVLNASQRNQLLAMQTTARGLDVASVRLASGLKVNNVLDQPTNFFAAAALKYRSNDLNRLLDGIGQNIQVIKAADTGLTAALKILDQAEAYLNGIETRLRNGELDLTETPVPADNETAITFNNTADLLSYGTAGQDVGGVITLIGDTGFTLDGNMWKRRLINYTVTPDTVLTFEYQSGNQPEISGIGFDNDIDFANSSSNFFLYGSQTTGVTYAAPTPTYQYDGSGNWVTVEIPIGTYFTGTFSHMTFFADDDGAGDDGDGSFNNIILREGPEQNNTALTGPDAVQAEYERILSQLDLVVADSSYRGVNLLDGDTMTTFFNENRTSKLLSEGIVASYAGLNLETGGFGTVEDVQTKIDQVRAAREKLRTYASSLAGDLNIIKTREDFTANMIATLDAGRDKLILADQNEEAARQLALQTRQQLQTSMLSFRQATILDILDR
jgi:hypothetical protein